MAVVNTKSTLIHDPLVSASVAPDPKLARGLVRNATGTVVNAADDSDTSSFQLVDLPSNCILLPETYVDVTSWGFAQVVVGVEGDTDALIDQTQATEDVISPIAAGDGNQETELWDLLGMASDPGGMIRLIASAEAGATGAGDMHFRFAYLVA